VPGLRSLVDGGANVMSEKTVYVVRSKLDGGAPGYVYEDENDARECASKLNDEYGLPDDHTVHKEVAER